VRVTYPSHVSVTYPSHVRVTYPSHVCVTYPSHVCVAYPSHAYATYLSHVRVTYPSHVRVTYPSHVRATYPSHVRVTYPSHVRVTYPSHVRGTYVTRMCHVAVFVAYPRYVSESASVMQRRSLSWPPTIVVLIKQEFVLIACKCLYGFITKKKTVETRKLRVSISIGPPQSVMAPTQSPTTRAQSASQPPSNYSGLPPSVANA
jgi:hypothetical protein